MSACSFHRSFLCVSSTVKLTIVFLCESQMKFCVIRAPGLNPTDACGRDDLVLCEVFSRSNVLLLDRLLKVGCRETYRWIAIVLGVLFYSIPSQTSLFGVLFYSIPSRASLTFFRTVMT
jgi:hypothetical protein